MLGSELILLVGGIVSGVQFMLNVLPQLAWVAFAGVVLEGIGLIAHARDLKKQGGEGAASHFEQRTRFGYAYVLRNVLLLINLVLLAVLATGVTPPIMTVVLSSVTLLSLLATMIISRALFYVLVIPTTMPGAFFWKNRGFEEHTRETGLANMPQVGVVPDSH